MAIWNPRTKRWEENPSVLSSQNITESGQDKLWNPKTKKWETTAERAALDNLRSLAGGSSNQNPLKKYSSMDWNNPQSRAAMDYNYITSTVDKIKNKEYVSPERIDSVSELLRKNTQGWAAKKNPTNLEANGNKLADAISSTKEYYSLFENEEDFKNVKAYQKSLGEDTEVLNSELKELEEQLEYAESLVTGDKIIGFVKRKYEGKEQDGLDSQLSEYLKEKGYKNIDELRKKVSEKRGNLAAIKKIQALNAISAPVMAAEDFEEKSIYNENVKSDGSLLSLEDTYHSINDTGSEHDPNKWKKSFVYNPDGSEKNMSSEYAKYYENMSKNEIKVFNYLVNTNQKEKAKQYLGTLFNILEDRDVKKYYDAEIKGSVSRKLANAAFVGLDQFNSGIKNVFNTKDEYIEPSYFQKLGGRIREDSSEVEKFAFDTISTTTNMLPSILVAYVTGDIASSLGASANVASAVSKLAGAGTLGLSAAGNAYAQAINSGYTKSQARTYSTLVGGSEALLSYAFSGISKLGGSVTGKSITKIVSGIDKGFWKFAAQFGLSSASEITEEMAQEILEPLFENIALGYNKNNFDDIDWSEVVYSGLMALVTTGVLEGAPSAVNIYSESLKAKNLYGYSTESVQALVDEGLSFSENSRAYKIAQKYKDKLSAGKKLSGTQLATLVEANEVAMQQSDFNKIKSATEKRLIELGESTNITKIAEAITKKTVGQDISREEREAINNSKYGIRVANELKAENIRAGDYSSYWAEIIDTERINNEEYSKSINDDANHTEDTDNSPITEAEQRLLNTPDEQLTPEQRAVKENIKERHSSVLRTGANNDIIYNNNSNDIRGGNNVVSNQGTIEESGGERRAANLGGTRVYEESGTKFKKLHSRGAQESSPQFGKRKVVNYGKSSVSYIEAAEDNTEGYKAYTAFQNAGINAVYCNGVIERIVNGIKFARTEAFTAPDGTVYISNQSTLPAKEIYDHERVHVADFTNSLVYDNYEAVLCDNVLYLSEKFRRLSEQINDNQFDGKYDIENIDSYKIFMREIAAYVNQYVLSDPEYAQSLFGEMFSDWNAVVEAVNKFNKNMGGEYNEVANSSTYNITLPENIKEISISNKNKKRHHTTLKEQNYIIGIGKVLGRKVVFENVVDKLRTEGIDLKGQIPDGYIDNNNVIHINFTVVDPLTFIFKHELTHFGEGTEAYNKFVDAVKKSEAFKNWLIEKTGLNTENISIESLIAAARDSVINSRTGDGTVDVEGAMAEVIADFVGDCLFTKNGSGLESMLSNLNVKERNAVIQYILDFLSYIKKKLAGYKDIEFEISRLEDSFNRMLSEATQVKAEGNFTSEGKKYTFARSYDTEAISKAEDMESLGAKHPEIWGETGLMRDGGGTWVYEIYDAEMQLYRNGNAKEFDDEYNEYLSLAKLKRRTPEKSKRFVELFDKYGGIYLEKNELQDFVKHDKLFEVYPQLRKIKIEFKDLEEEGHTAYYSDFEKKIVIDKSLWYSNDITEIKKTLIHELQHAVQHIDKREEGASEKFWNARILSGKRMPINYRTGKSYTLGEDTKAYLDTAGEMEAREAAERFDYTGGERKLQVFAPLFAPQIDYNKSIKKSEFLKETVSPAVAEGYIEAVNSNDINTAQRLVDQAANKSGYTERLYHQTGEEFTEFNTNNQIAGKYDWELPAGTFLKPSNNDIGLSGKKQMELYAKFENALAFKNRSEARNYWIDNIPEYKIMAQKLASLDSQYRRKTDEAMDNVRQYLKEWRQKNPSVDSREIYKDSEYQRLNDLEDKIVDEWEQKSNEASLRAKQLLNDYISKSDFDGIIIEKDEGSGGRATKTYIAFDSSQLKDASPVTYDDNGDVIPLSARFDSNKKDIRYSIPRGEAVEKYDEQQYNDFGWTRHNGILSNKAFNLLTEKIAEIKHGGSFHKSKYGEYIIPVGDENGIYNILVYTDGNMESPHIRKIIKINAKENFILQQIAEDIYYAEQAKQYDAYWYVKEIYGEENISQHKRNDSKSFWQYSREQEGTAGSKNYRGNREWSNGRKTSSNSKGIQINKFSIPSKANSLLDRYENGEISREDYQQQLDELWKSANEEYGTIKQGEKAKTPLAIPKAVEDGMPTKQFIRTVIETGKLTSEMIEDIEQEVLLGDTYSYKVVSDENAQKKAEKSFEKGIAEESWNKAISTRIISKEDIAIGEKLLLQAIENNERLKVVELSAELSDALTRSGQVVQAARMLKKMSGLGRLVTAQKNVKTINKSLQEKYGDKAPTVKLNPLLAEQLVKTKTPKEIEMVYGEVLSDIASQVPATWLDKLNAWRYFAMLSNPRTHIRNLVSNMVFTPSIMVKRFIATGAEHLFIKDAEKRTKAVFIKKEYMDFAKKDIKNREVKNMLQGKGQLDDKAIIEELRQTFETKWLESLTKGNSNLLEAEDMWFKSHHYKVAFASFLQARKVNLKNVNETTLQEAREYAVKEAKKATFQDVSKLANWLNNIKNPVAKIAVEGVLPFKRTPINIIKRGVEYSPIGLMERLSIGLIKVRKGEITVSEYCDGLAAAITGTGLTALGWVLASAGMVVGGFGDDEEDKFKQLNGEQEYSVQIFGKSYTIDWAAPAAIPFFIGVELAEEIEEGNGFQFKDIPESFWNALEPVTNLSMLSGVQGLIEAVRYEDSSRTIGTMLGDIATNFAMQLIPSAFGATSRTIDSTQRTWYTDKNSSLDAFSQSTINNVKSKVPGLSYTQIPKIDAWGREVKRGSAGERIVENFISPGYYSQIEVSEAEEELKRLYKNTGENVFPKTAAKYFTVNGETKHLTAEEYVRYAKAKGEYSLDYIEEFTDCNAYKKLTDAERVEVIKNLYEYANAKAKTEVSEYDIMKQYKTVTNWERDGKSAVIYYISKAIN